jgi:hypothetical protein
MRIKDYIDVLAIIAAAAAFSMLIVGFTQHYFQEREKQVDKRAQDIIIRGKLYNCEEAK